MSKYKVKNTTILHNGKSKSDGDIIELTDEQAKKLVGYVEKVEETQTLNTSNNSDTSNDNNNAQTQSENKTQNEPQNQTDNNGNTNTVKTDSDKQSESKKSNGKNKRAKLCTALPVCEGRSDDSGSGRNDSPERKQFQEGVNNGK